MLAPIDLPPEFERLADLLIEQPRKVRDLFRYALVLALINDVKANMTRTRIERDRDYLTIQTIAGDVLKIPSPLTSGSRIAEARADDADDRGRTRELRTGEAVNKACLLCNPAIDMEHRQVKDFEQ